MRRHYVGVMAFDLQDNGRRIGPGGVERCAGAKELYSSLDPQENQVEVLASAGYADRKRFPDQRFTLATMTGSMLVLLGVNDRHMYVLNDSDIPPVWGSEAEIVDFFAHADEECQGDEYVMHIVSHKWHIPRLRLLVWALGRKAVFYGVEGSTHAIKYEFYKYPGQLMKTLRAVARRKFRRAFLSKNYKRKSSFDLLRRTFVSGPAFA